MLRIFILIAGLTVAATAALADGTVQKLMTPADKDKLEQYGESRKTALQ